MAEQGGSSSKDARKRKRSGPRSRTSEYLGVTRVRGIACTTFTISACIGHCQSACPGIISFSLLGLSMHVCRAKYKRTGRWEAHIWDSSDPGSRKGKQLHLGSFPAARPAAMCALHAMRACRGGARAYCRHAAWMSACILLAVGSAASALVPCIYCRTASQLIACMHARRAYDRAAFKLRSGKADFNFPDTNYSQDSFLKVRITFSLHAHSTRCVVRGPPANMALIHPCHHGLSHASAALPSVTNRAAGSDILCRWPSHVILMHLHAVQKHAQLSKQAFILKLRQWAQVRHARPPSCIMSATMTFKPYLYIGGVTHARSV